MQNAKLQDLTPFPQPILFRVDADSPYLIIVAGERRFGSPGNHPGPSESFGSGPPFLISCFSGRQNFLTVDN
jgi:hypothetical protein